MEFCKKCGGMVVPRKVENKVVSYCRSCGEKSKVEAESKLSEKIEKRDKIISIADSNSQYPVTEITCDKCGNKNAFWFMQQTRGIDEPPTTFFKCTKCSYCWRDYS